MADWFDCSSDRSVSKKNKRTGTMKLEGRIAIVTGGTGGIGRAVCDRFTAEGAAVVVVVDRAEPGYEMKPGQEFRQGSVADPEFWRSLVEELEDRYGAVDVLVNNA